MLTDAGRASASLALLLIVSSGCGVERRASLAAQPPLGPPERIHATMTSVCIPGGQSVTPDQYAAWWAGVTVGCLKPQLPAGVASIPALATPTRAVRRTYYVAPQGGDPWVVQVYLPSGRALLMAPPCTARPGGAAPASVERAECIALEFMALRGFTPAQLARRTVVLHGQDSQGQNLTACTAFAGLLPGGGSARVWVDLRQGTVGVAQLDLPAAAPAPGRPEPALTPKQACAALRAELASRGTGRCRIRSVREWSPTDGIRFDAPYYAIVVDRRRAARDGAGPPVVHESWYVNGNTGQVASEGEMPARVARATAPSL